MNNRLEFIVSLLDRVSAPAGKVMKSLDQISKTAEAGYRRIGYGVAGLVGAGYSVAGLVGPARDMNRALGSLTSLDAAPDVLAKLDKQAKLFAANYGESAAAFTASAYDIQSAISGLRADELPAFTYAGNLLAKGTKANADTITNYMGTMYKVFSQTADAMGRSAWVEQLAGQTAMAVKIFKTTGKGMADAFEGVGANSTAAMHEQIAILGTLQGTLKGSEAGTKYTAFLDGLTKAQDALGLKFEDSQGKMLPIVDILERIRGKYGAIDTLAKAEILKKAFGTKEGVDVIKLLMTDIEGLKSSIATIGSVKGLEQVEKMARAMVDPIDRVTAGATSLSVAIGQKMMSAMTPTLDKIVAIEKRLIGWTDQFPKLTALIGKGTLSVFGLIAAVSALSIAVGVSKFLLIGWGVAVASAKAMLVLASGAVSGLSAVLGMLSAPVLAVGAVVAGAAFLIYKYWLPIKAFFIGFWDGLSQGLEPLVSRFSSAFSVIASVFTPLAPVVDWLADGVQRVVSWFAGLFGPVEQSTAGIAAASNAGRALGEALAMLAKINPFAVLGQGIDWLLGKLDGLLGKLGQIPGVGSLVKSILPAAPAPTPPPAALSAAGRANVPAGGIVNQISQKNGGFQFRDLHVNNYGERMTGQQLANELAFAAP